MKILKLIPLAFLLTSCLSDEDIKKQALEFKEKRNQTLQIIQTKDYSLDNSLKIHEYFFSFAEKIHLIHNEDRGKKIIQSFIKSLGPKGFCESFIVPSSFWKDLENYCRRGPFYKCSPEIQNYPLVLSRFKESLDTEYKKKLEAEPLCN